MKEDQAAKIILIRAVEECDKEAFLDDDLKNAFSKAGNRIGDANWFVNRATYLTERLSPTHKFFTFNHILFPMSPRWGYIFS